MKRKSTKAIATESEMLEEAEQLTFSSHVDGQNDCSERWAKLIGCPNDEIEGGLRQRTEQLCQEALDYFATRCNELDEGYCSPRIFLCSHCIHQFITFDSFYNYKIYRWNGTSYDPEEVGAFAVEEECDYWEFLRVCRTKVVKAFKDYLIHAAALAKLVGSDAYQLWRDLIIEVEVELSSLEYSIPEKDAIALYEKILSACQITWADVVIGQQMAKQQGQQMAKQQLAVRVRSGKSKNGKKATKVLQKRG